MDAIQNNINQSFPNLEYDNVFDISVSSRDKDMLTIVNNQLN